MSDDLFDADERALLEEAVEDTEPLLLVEAYDLILDRTRPLSRDGWELQGGELLAHILPLQTRANDALGFGVNRIDSATYSDGGEASDEALLAALGPGEVSWFEGSRWFLPKVLVDLRERVLEVQRLQTAVGLVVRVDEDGGAGFHFLDLSEGYR